VKLYGSGENVRDWIHVTDHCRAVYRVIREGQLGETYLVGAESERDNRTVLSEICHLMGFDPEEWIEPVPDRPGHDLRYAIDSAKIRRELGWEPAYDFETGLAQTIDWYRENESWWLPQKEAAETRYAALGR
jgi:dTDP-glucose 4,6-dehydratase